MDRLSPNHYFDLSSYTHRALFKECTYVWEALSQIKGYLESLTLGRIEVDIPENVFLINPDQISIGKGTVVEPGSYIKGPCVIGENCTVRHGAYIRGDLITGNHCVLGHDSEFKHSILLNHAHAAHFAYVGDSILGNHVNLGAGTVCANLRLNKQSVALYLDKDRVETGLRKMGAIFGDHAQTGCNSVMNPGTLFGKQAVCYPCLNIGGIIDSGEIIRKSL